MKKKPSNTNLKLRDISRKELLKILKKKGYSYLRTTGGHEMYSNGNHVIAIPTNIHKWLAVRILHQCNIPLEEVLL